MPNSASVLRRLDGSVLFFSGLAMGALGIFVLGWGFTIAGAVFALIGLAVIAYRRTRD